MKTFILCLCLISITIAVLVILRQLYIVSKFSLKTIVNPFSLNMLVWHSIDEEVPTKEKQYLCCDIYRGKAYFKVLWWSNNLYEVDDFRFSNRKGKCGFYRYDNEWEYLKSFCDYWQEIEWRDEDDK